MRMLVAAVIALTLMAGCAIVPVGPYHGAHYRPYHGHGYYGNGHGPHGGHGYHR